MLEDDRVVSVCTAVLDSELERQVEITVTTKNNNAAGKLNIIIQLLHEL